MIDFWDFDNPLTLCQYFWKLMGCLLLSLLAITIAPILLLVFLGVILKEWVEEKWHKHRSKRFYKPPREPGVVLSYLRAVKNKVCPIIDYYDSSAKTHDPPEKPGK